MDKWESNEVFAENLMEGRRWLREEQVSLSGKWRFFCQRADLPLPEGWEKPDFPDKKWRRIPVPGSWEQSEICESWFRGENPPAPFLGPSGSEMDQSLNLVGLYRRSFILSKDHGSRQILLRFHHIRSCARVWVNGIYIGMVKEPRTASEFDITSAVHPDKNHICVQVLRYSDVTPLEKRGQWIPSGILGDVELYSLPSRRLTDIQSTLRRNQEGTPLLDLKILVENADGFTARIALMDEKGVVGYSESPIIDGTATALISCQDVKLWSAETPELYRVAVILWDGIAMYHTRQTTIGFRQVDTQEGILHVNGRHEKLYALTYRPFDPDSGTVPSADVLESELRIIRDHNFNAVCVSGVVPEALFDVCDRIGLYVLYNCGLTDDDTHREYLVFQHRRLANTLHSHPSLIAWDLEQNHTGILPMDRFCILTEPGASAIRQFLGTEVTTPDTQTSRKRRTQSPAAMTVPDDKPILIESSGAGELNDYIDLIRANKRLCGGVFGVFRDYSFLGKLAPEGSEGFMSVEGVLRPRIREAKSILQPIRCSFENEMLTIENHGCFLGTDNFDGKYVLTLDGSELLSRPLEVSAAPGESLRIPLEIRYDIFKPGRYHLSVQFKDRKNGRLIASDQWAVGHLKHIYDENPGGTIREDSGSILMRAQDTAYVISRATGSLEQLRLEELELLKQPLYPVYSHGSVGSGLRLPDEWEKLTTRKKKPRPSVLEVDHMTRTVTASFHLGSGLMQTCRLFSDGSLHLELRLRTGRSAPERLGLSCVLPPEYSQFRWFGLGPDDCGTKRGQFFALHGHRARKDAGFKDSVYHLSLTSDAGRGIHIRCEEGMRVLASEESEGIRLTLEQLRSEPMKPHTTYTFSITLRPV